MELGRIDSVVRRAASIDLENDGKVKFYKNMRYSSIIPRRQTSTSIFSSTGCNRQEVFPWVLAYAVEFNEGEIRP